MKYIVKERSGKCDLTILESTTLCYFGYSINTFNFRIIKMLINPKNTNV